MLFILNGFCRFGHVLFSIPVAIRTQEAVLSGNRDSTKNSILQRPRWKQTCMSKTGPILVFLRIHPFARVFFSFRGNVYSRHRCYISFGPSSVSNIKKCCPFSTIFKPASEHSFGSLLVVGQLFEFALVVLHQVSLSLFVGMRVINRRFSGNFHHLQIFKCVRFPQSPRIFGLFPVIDLLLLRGY